MIKEDFEIELNHVGFEIKKIITGNESIKEALLEEFSHLDPRPKMSLYMDNFIDPEKYKEELTNFRWPAAPAAENEILKDVYEKSVRDWENSEVAKVKRLSLEFHELCSTNALDAKYYGRFIEDTNIIRALNEIKKEIDDFKEYVLVDTKVDYLTYAQQTCRKIIALLERTGISELKNIILDGFIEDKENVLITIKHLWKTAAENERHQAMQNYNVLKKCADDFFRNELKEHQIKDKKSPITLEYLFFNKKDQVVSFKKILNTHNRIEGKVWIGDLMDLPAIIIYLKNELKLIRKINIPKTKLHETLSKEFEKVGTREHFSNNINKIEDMGGSYPLDENLKEALKGIKNT